MFLWLIHTRMKAQLPLPGYQPVLREDNCESNPIQFISWCSTTRPPCAPVDARIKVSKSHGLIDRLNVVYISKKIYASMAESNMKTKSYKMNCF